MKKVLIVDDEKEIRETTLKMVEGIGCFVVACPNAEEALWEVRKNHFDLLLTDVKMDEINGFTLVSESKRLRPDIKVIIITGYPTNWVFKMAKKIGADHFIAKPCAIKTLKVLVEDCLNGVAS